MTEFELNVQGKFKKYPGKETVINKLRNGEEVLLRIELDHRGQIIVVDCNTDEGAGCIPPNPSYIDKYDVLRNALFSNDLPVVSIRAIEACSKNKHYRARVTIF